MDTKHLILSQVIKCSDCCEFIPTNLYSNYLSYEVSARLTEEIKRCCEQLHHLDGASVCALCGDEIAKTSIHMTPASEVNTLHERYSQWQSFAFLLVHPKCVGSEA